MARFKLHCFWDVTAGSPPPKCECSHIHDDGTVHNCTAVQISASEFHLECTNCGEVMETKFTPALTEEEEN